QVRGGVPLRRPRGGRGNRRLGGGAAGAPPVGRAGTGRAREGGVRAMAVMGGQRVLPQDAALEGAPRQEAEANGAHPGAAGAPQATGFLSGNDMAALAVRQINRHVMGYYPITPSTEIAEILSKEAAAGKHDIVMIPADGEHGAAG